ncbi:MAG TPA: MGMT family protein [Gemmatimonadota bacterium]|nr:MGMT family protein [Gemmatimonadota bacterium]
MTAPCAADNVAHVRSFYDRVYDEVRRIPPGTVTTYGHVAALAGNPRAARTVGWALHALPDGTDVPWQRVVNARGGISISKIGLPAELQRALLEAEGVEFRVDGTVDLDRWGWPGPEVGE